MKVFISWSGDKSKNLAEEIKKWLPAVIQAVRPYYSPDDITKGSRWSAEIAQILEESRIGLICLTQENLEAPWVMFEAGALSKNLDKSKVAPILFGVEPTDLKGPLVQFQSARFEKADIKRIVQMINSELGEGKLANEILDSVFEMWWPRLEEKIKAILEKEIPTSIQTKRSERDLLEEILMTVRSQARRQVQVGAGLNIHPQAAQDLVKNYKELVNELISYGVAFEFIPVLESFLNPIQHVVRRASMHNMEEDSDIPLMDILKETVAQLKETASAIDEDDEIPF